MGAAGWDDSVRTNDSPALAGAALKARQVPKSTVSVKLLQYNDLADYYVTTTAGLA